MRSPRCPASKARLGAKNPIATWSSTSAESKAPPPGGMMFHVKHEVPPNAAVPMDHESQGQLRRYEALLRERAVPFGLIGAADRDRLWERHILDSLRGAVAVRANDVDAYDLGSGAGLPGI